MKVRLNKYLSMCGVSSRRKADDLIAEGKVTINGEVANELGCTVDTESDTVELNGRSVKIEGKRYIALNKPKHYLSAIGADKKKRTISELITDIPERVYPVGRLDYDVEGLLILTNDGELTNRIIHPRYELSKQYLALVKGKVSKKTLSDMRKGAELEDGFVVPDKIEIMSHGEKQSSILVWFHEGKNHLVKRYFAHFDHPVEKLKRLSVGPVELGGLRSGKWRELESSEINMIREMTGMSSDK